MFDTKKIVERLEEVCTLLDHMSGQLDSIARLLRMQIEQDSVEFEADEEAFELNRETLTA